MAELTTKKRNALKTSTFALPGRRYPINDASHARNALSRVSGNGTPEEKSKVRAAVHSKYPSIGKMHEGGMIPQDGQYDMKKGEMVTPANEVDKKMDSAMAGLGSKGSSKEHHLRIHKLDGEGSSTGFVVTHHKSKDDHEPLSVHAIEDVRGLKKHIAEHYGEETPETSGEPTGETTNKDSAEPKKSDEKTPMARKAADKKEKD